MPPPDRWNEYQPLGSLIPDTRFIAFKVPLKEGICRNLPENESFSPQQLIDLIQESGRRLGLVVDLTFTRKYYNGQYFEKRNIQYKKIFTAGHEVPNDEVVQEFHEAVDDFSMNNTDEDVVIGVHCTHGVNRTGYLVCRYMIDRLKMDPSKAIELFGFARGHPIERENYLKDLRKRSMSGNIMADSSGWSRGETEGHRHNSTQSPDFQQHEHDRDDMSWKRSRPPPQHNRRRGGRGHPHNGPFSQPDRHGEALLRGGPSRRGQTHNVFSSPLEQFDHEVQSGWGSAAQSGWGSSGKGYPGQGFSRDRGRPPRRHFHNQQNYSWRRSDQPQSQANSQSYRDRTEDPRDGSDPRGPGRADRDRNWRHRDADDGVTRRGRDFGGYPRSYSSNSYSSTQDWHSGNFTGGHWNGGSSGGALSSGWNEGWGDGGNNGRWGWNGGWGGDGRSNCRGWWNEGWGGEGMNNGRGGWHDGRGGGGRGRGGWNRGGRNEGRGAWNGNQSGPCAPNPSYS